MPRVRRLLALLMPLALLGAAGGPDDGDLVFTDSDEDEGPPAQPLELDALNSSTLDLGADGGQAVSLPFTLTWYGDDFDAVTVLADGALLFEGEADDLACPGAGGAWSGVAAFADDLDAGTVRTATAGRYPYRAFAVEWVAGHAAVGGSGRVQAWLVEDRQEAVIVLDDIAFGHVSVDGGASAFVGAQGSSSTGLAWSCSGGLSDGSAAWFGRRGKRPTADRRETDDLSRAWIGESAFQYAARSLGSGDLDGDGYADVVVGNPDEDLAFVLLGGALPARGGLLSDGDAVVYDTESSRLAAAIVAADIDGDGVADLALGAPYSSGSTLSRVGAVRVLAGGTIGGDRAVQDADLTLAGPDDSRAQAGAALAGGDVDGDGYPDLVVGAPYHDAVAEDAGAVYLWRGGASALDTDASLEDGPRWDGGETQDFAGAAVAVGDLDGDGAAELVVGAPEADSTEANAGLTYVLAGGAGLTGGDLADEATLIVVGSAENDRAGSALAVGDLSGDGIADLVVGVPYFDDPLSAAGGAFVFIDPLGGAATLALGDADRTITGSASNANAGAALAIGDLDGDDALDLVVAAPNKTGAATGGGVVAIFTDASVSSAAIDDAEHRLLGTSTGGELGLALAISGPAVDHDGDGLAELWSGAPYDDGTATGEDAVDSAGAVYGLELTPDFLDDDGDGFVSITAGGIDCDDGDSAVFPGAGEAAGDLVDNDCDGWVDDLVVVRRMDEHWVWDLEAELGMDSPILYDHEAAEAGDDIEDLYASEGLRVSAGGRYRAQGSVFGSLARGELAATFTPISDNRVDLIFDDLVDGVGLWLLDAEGEFLLSAYDPDGLMLDELPLSLDADQRAGGSFVGLTFARGVDRLRLVGPGVGGWGLDDIELAWAELSDRDGDGWSDAAGDCDDEDAAVSPSEAELLGNGIDDDCDGVVDGGEVTTYEDPAEWEAAAGIEAELVDFEELALGGSPTDDYGDLGVLLDGSLVVVDDVDGAAPRDAQGAQADADSVVLSFTEAQPAVALWLLDAEGTVTLTGSLDGAELYVAEVDADGGDVDGGVFVGLVWDVGVDSLELSVDRGTATWGLDDLVFSVLGLDDADGDGLTEREGDCDDTDPDTHAGAEETWYDGVDGDCDGASDYDADGDGVDHDGVGGTGLDCDDGDAAVFPGAEETWYDGLDSDCDGLSDFDADKDGHDDLAWGGDDCDDGDSAISPDATETWYDGVDADCAGDDDYDADGDGWVPAGFGVSGTFGVGDCDDGDGGVSPGADEAWYDGIDSDCDGASDYDSDGDGFDSTAYGGDDCQDEDPDSWPGAPGDICYDGTDTDCDGWSDDDCDRDGYDSEDAGGLDCDDDDPEISPDADDSPGDGIDSDCDGAAEFDDDGDGVDGVEDGGTDCDDDDASVYPGATETWYDGVDSDCAGDDDDDADGDGYPGEPAGGDDCDDSDPTVHPGAIDYYYDGVDSDCDGSMDYDGDGDGWPADWYGGADCDDTDPDISPDAIETWYDGVDSDCDGWSDYDADEDGWDSEAWGGLDCDDDDAAISPSGVEIPGDGIDQDCDGGDDVDIDGDGYGSSRDCDDDDAAVHPGAAETWYDGVDGDCDEGSDFDADGDGADSDAWGGADCDDADAEVGPGAVERWYDGIDADCAGDDDYDADGDGWRAIAWGGGDCDDSDPARNPGVASDGCGGGDEDCDGVEDEDCGAGDGGSPDGGSPDGGVEDGGAGDGGSPDGGVEDGGASDGGVSDGGASDGGTEGDGGASDGGAGGWVDPGTTPGGKADGCGGCSSGGGDAAWWLGALILGLRRRR